MAAAEDHADYLAAMIDALAEDDHRKAAALRDLALDAVQQDEPGLGVQPSAEATAGVLAARQAFIRSRMTQQEVSEQTFFDGGLIEGSPEQSRGQPENAGQFGPGGGGRAKDAPKKTGGQDKPAAAVPEQPAAFAYPAGYKPPSPNSAPSEKLPPASQPPLDASEAKALDWYAADGYRALNAALYQGADLTWSKAGAEGVVASVMGGRGLGGRPKVVHQQLQQAFAKVEPFAQPVAVSRGLSFRNDQAKADYVARFEQAAASGGVVELAGYQSTTVGGGLVGNFANSPVTLAIDAVAGLDVGPYSLYHHESELLLEHNSAFLVKGVERDHLGRVTIRLEQQLPAKNRKQSLTESTIMIDDPAENEVPIGNDDGTPKPTPEEAFRERVAGAAPPADSVKVLTPEEAAAKGYTRHPKAKD